MKTFTYKARDRLGKLISGIISAESSDEAVHNLKERNYLPISIKELKKTPSFLQSFKKRVTLSEINVFSRQLSALLKAGIPLLASLSSIKEQTKNRIFEGVLSDTTRDIKSGSSFSEALSKHENIFGKIYVSMIKAAETAGTLGEVLERLAVFGEREEDIKAQIKAAATYPVMVVGALAIAFFVLVSFVVPKFTKIFFQFGADLPLPTRILIGLNQILNSFWYLLIIAGVLLIAGARFFINTPKGRFFWHKLRIQMPIIGALTLKIILSRFSRVLSILTRTGVPIVKVLDLTGGSVTNCVISKAIADISNKVTQGESLSLAMRESGLFPPIVIQMVSAGEETGRLDDLSAFVSDYYDSQIKYTLKNLVSYIEPILIFILGIGVLFIALAVFLPMWNLIRLFQH